MTYFFDRNIPIRIARMLDAYECVHQVIHQDDDARFSPQTRDIELLESLSAELPKPIFVTADVHIRRRPHERKALAESELTVVFLKGGFLNQSMHAQAMKILGIWPELVKTTTRAKEPTAFEITAAFKKLNRLGSTASLAGGK